MSRRATVVLAAVLASGCAFSPDEAKRNRALEGLVPERPATDLEVVVELPRPPGNVAVGPDGRVYFTFHPEAAPDLKLVELLPGGKVVPYPDESWQSDREGKPSWKTPLAVRIDGRGRLWVLDHADYAWGTPSLTAFDLKTRAVVHRYELPEEIADWGSLLNDFVVDDERGFIYIADTSPFEFDPAIIVYDIAKQSSRRVLEDHPSVSAEDLHTVVQGRFMKVYGMVLKLDVDTIALSPDREWLYYGPLTGGTLWRVPTAVLRDASLDDAAIATKVEAYSKKPVTDGGVAGPDGAVYLTAIEHDAIAVVRPDRKLAVLVQDREKLAWPDGLAVSPDGQWLYATASELHHVIGKDLDDLPEHRPYRILRIRIGRAP